MKKLLNDNNNFIFKRIFFFNRNILVFSFYNAILKSNCLRLQIRCPMGNFYLSSLRFKNFLLHFRLALNQFLYVNQILSRKNTLIFYINFIFFGVYGNNKNFKINWILSFVSFFKLICSIASTRILIFHLGLRDSLQVTGYFRRLWYSKSKKLVFLRLGRSFINKVLISKKILIKVFKRRIIKFYASSVRIMKKIARSIYFLQPVDIYKGSGIKLFSLKFKLKKRISRK